MIRCSACGQENPDIAQFCLACGPAAGRRQASVARGAADRHGHLRRLGRLHLARGDARPRGRAGHPRALPRPRSRRDRVVRRGGREVHRRRRGRRVRRAHRLRGRPRAGGAGGLSRPGGTPGHPGAHRASTPARRWSRSAPAPELGEAMVAGDVINTAARLQSAAPAGGVLVGAETYACTNGRGRLRRCRAGAGQGQGAMPVEVWLADRVASEATAGPGTPLVGRVGELSMLPGSGSGRPRAHAPPRDGARASRRGQDAAGVRVSRGW